MKRSTINNYQTLFKDYLSKYNFALPPWAYWSPEDWLKVGKECIEIKEKMLGWDLTDFGNSKFAKNGLLLFSMRNGDPDGNSPKNYAEKIMMSLPGQITPLHFHWQKTEDIINRNGGRLAMKFWKATVERELSEELVIIQIDGITKEIPAGQKIVLLPGESVTLMPLVYHTFWAEDIPCLVGEISKTNNDLTDNCFYEEVGRFPSIEEDEKPLHLLCTEYPDFE